MEINKEQAIRSLAELAAHREGVRLMLKSIRVVLLALEPTQQAPSVAAQLRPVLKTWRGQLLSMPQMGLADELQPIADRALRTTTEEIARLLGNVLDEFDGPGAGS